MINYIHLVSDENGYKKYNQFQTADTLQSILFDDYYLYKTDEFKKDKLVEKLYKKNFYDKYNRETQGEIFSLYIDNEEFKKKALFIYSIIDEQKFIKFAQENPQIENPNELTISYSVVDSSGVKIELYNISIADIAFVF